MSVGDSNHTCGPRVIGSDLTHQNDQNDQTRQIHHGAGNFKIFSADNRHDVDSNKSKIICKRAYVGYKTN